MFLNLFSNTMKQHAIVNVGKKKSHKCLKQQIPAQPSGIEVQNVFNPPPLQSCMATFDFITSVNNEQQEPIYEMNTKCKYCKKDKKENGDCRFCFYCYNCGTFLKHLGENDNSIVCDKCLNTNIEIECCKCKRSKNIKEFKYDCYCIDCSNKYERESLVKWPYIDIDGNLC